MKTCCEDLSHITIFSEAGYGAQLCAGVKEVAIHLRSLLLLHTRRIKAAKILNPWVLMGLAGSDTTNPQDILKLWGADPVHPMDTAFTKMAEKVLEEVNMTGVVNSCQTVSPSVAREATRHSAGESWTEETPTIANRMGKWSHSEHVYKIMVWSLPAPKKGILVNVM